MWKFPLHLHVIPWYWCLILCSTFKYRALYYTVVNGSTVIVCKLNNFRYCTCTFEVQCTSLMEYTVVNGSTVIVCKHTCNNVRYCIHLYMYKAQTLFSERSRVWYKYNHCFDNSNLSVYSSNLVLLGPCLLFCEL